MNFSRVEFNEMSPDLVANRAFTRSQTQEGRQHDSGKRSYNRDNNPNGGHGGNNRGLGGGRGNGSANRQQADDQQQDGHNIPFKQCLCCGKPGHEGCDCRQKGSFVKLSQWY